MCLKKRNILLLIIITIIITENVSVYCMEIDLKDGWEYNIGKEKNENDVWKRVSNFKDFSDKVFENGIWFKRRLPDEPMSNKSIYFEMIYAQNLQIFIEDELMYEVKRKYLMDINRVVLKLDEKYRNKSIYLKVDSIYQKYGPNGKIIFDDYVENYKKYILHDIKNVFIGAIILTLGFLILILSIFLKEKKEAVTLSILLMSLGVIVAIYPYGVVMFQTIEKLTVLTFSITVLFVFVSLSACFYIIFKSIYGELLKKIILFQCLYSVVSIVFSIINLFLDYKLIGIEKIISMDLLGILLFSQLLLIIIIVIKRAVNEDVDARIFAFGILVAALSSIYDLLLYGIFNKNHMFNSWSWGLLFFVISIITIYGRREIQNHNKIILHSKQLAAKNIEIQASENKLAIINRTLENRIDERTFQLNKANKVLKAKNDELSAALQKLEKMKIDLVKSDKLAVVGRMASSITHDICTPLGALNSSLEGATGLLERVCNNFFKLVEVLGDKKESYVKLLRKINKKSECLSIKEETKYKKLLEKQMSDYNIENKEQIIYMFVLMGIFKMEEDLLPLIEDENNMFIINTAYNLAKMYNNFIIMKTANDEISKAVFSLKSYAKQNHTDKMARVNIEDTVEIVLVLYLNQFKKGVEVVKNYCKVPPLLCYENEITQVWSNLIRNSLQAMDNKGKIIINIKKVNDFVCVSVIDNGKGIKKEIQDRIFDPFFTTKPSGEGSGIGLDTVKKIITKHHGRINVYSKPGKTQFEVMLPIM